MVSTQYYIYAEELGVQAFRLKLQLDGVNEDGALVFSDDAGNEYPLTSNRIRQLQSDNLLIAKSVFDNNSTPIYDNAKQLADVLNAGDYDQDAVETITRAGRELFTTQVRILKEQRT